MNEIHHRNTEGVNADDYPIENNNEEDNRNNNLNDNLNNNQNDNILDDEIHAFEFISRYPYSYAKYSLYY